MTIREKIENNLVIYFFGVLILGFTTGISAHKWVLEIFKSEVNLNKKNKQNIDCAKIQSDLNQKYNECEHRIQQYKTANQSLKQELEKKKKQLLSDKLTIFNKEKKCLAELEQIRSKEQKLIEEIKRNRTRAKKQHVPCSPPEWFLTPPNVSDATFGVGVGQDENIEIAQRIADNFARRDIALSMELINNKQLKQNYMNTKNEPIALAGSRIVSRTTCLDGHVFSLAILTISKYKQFYKNKHNDILYDELKNRYDELKNKYDKLKSK